jgi:ABC-2 type transport system ATP-binding protein
MIDIEHLSFHYSDADGAALQDIELVVDGRSLFGLLGPNGAGKTTLLSILSGLLPCPVGTVIIDGVDIARSPSALHQLISLVPQEYAFYPSLTVSENLRVFAGIQGIDGVTRKQRIAEVCELTSLGDRGSQRADKLSGGLKRRLNIAIGLLNRPRLLYLDEPTVGIDPQSRRFILEAIKSIHQQGTAVVYTSHYMEEVEYLCDHIAIIDQGRLLLQGSLRQLLQQHHGHSLVVELDAELSPQQAATLEQQGFSHQQGQLSCHTTGGEDIYRCLGLLHGQQVAIARIHYGSRNLEELFLNLTRRSLRD